MAEPAPGQPPAWLHPWRGEGKGSHRATVPPCHRATVPPCHVRSSLFQGQIRDDLFFLCENIICEYGVFLGINFACIIRENIFAQSLKKITANREITRHSVGVGGRGTCGPAWRGSRGPGAGGRGLCGCPPQSTAPRGTPAETRPEETVEGTAACSQTWEGGERWSSEVVRAWKGEDVER